MRKILLAGLSCIVLCFAQAQDKWSLERCVSYALQHNAQVRRALVTSKEYKVRLNTARNNRLPDLNASFGQNIYFGRGPSRDGTYKDNTQMSMSMGATASLTVFAGWRIKHDISARHLDLEASLQDLERAREDLSLQITSLFLQALFCKELVGVAERQTELSRRLVERNELMLQGGRSVEAALLESRAQLSNDELNQAQAENNLTLALLALSQALSRESAEDFDIEPPVTDSISPDALDRIEQPAAIFEIAVSIRPMIRAEELRLESSARALQIAKAARYPQVVLSGGYSNSYFYSFVSGYNNVAFFNQLRNNGNEFIGLSVNIPIFNRMATRNQISSARIAIEAQQIAVSEARLALRKEIETAYYNVHTSFKKYTAAAQSVLSATEVFNYEENRVAAGRSNMYDYNDAKMRLEKAESNMLQAKYEFIFNRKILGFYAGESIAR